jgi:hypothetical protein
MSASMSVLTIPGTSRRMRTTSTIEHQQAEVLA